MRPRRPPMRRRDRPGPDPCRPRRRPAGRRAVPHDYGGPDRGADVVALFAERVADYRATVQRTASRAAAAIGAASSRPRRPARGGARRAARRLAGGGDRVVVRRDDPPLRSRISMRVDGVITGRAVAIAETGTIVLDARPRPGSPGARLLPDLHVCVVRADQIVGDRARGPRPPRPPPAADLDQRPVGDERHRAQPGRGRPRPARARRRDRGLITERFGRRHLASENTSIGRSRPLTS